MVVVNPDPAKFVAVAAMKAVQVELTALETNEAEREVNEIIQGCSAK